MDNLFYLFGILYFVVSTYNFFTYDHNRDVSVDVDTNISDLLEETEKKQQETQAETIKKYYIILIQKIILLLVIPLSTEKRIL